MAFSECHVRRLTYWDFVPNPSGDSVPCTPGGDAPAGVLLSAAKIYKLPSERKSCPNTLPFKSFWGRGDLFSKRSRTVLPKGHGEPPFCKKGLSPVYSYSVLPHPEPRYFYSLTPYSFIPINPERPRSRFPFASVQSVSAASFAVFAYPPEVVESHVVIQYPAWNGAYTSSPHGL